MLKTFKGHLRMLTFVVGFGGAALIFLAVGALDRFAGREVLMMAAYDTPTIAINRALHVPGDPVAEIYGNPLSRTVRVLFVGEPRIVHPREDPALSLLPVDKSAAENPLQVQTLWFFARFVIGGLLLLGFSGLVVPRRWRRELRAAPGATG
ncbi:MAG: hypothetical protein Q9Q40_05735 [Acidobacteriota bacterium]|nr:hypothetical protein [Acidobacteriota bacterium]MDQ7087464.1 hypothetical protein [Acidobacteriota bacterium]